MPSANLRIVPALLFVLFCSSPSETQTEKPPEERVWFAVEERPRGQMRMEPFARVSDGTLVRAPSPCTEEDAGAEPFASAHLQPGQAYPVLFGGTAAGEVRVVARQPNSLVASVAYEGPAKLRGQIRALATNDARGAFRVESRQLATKEDRAAALSLARRIFQQHGIPEQTLPKVHVDFLTRTVMEPSSQSSWIGSFTLDMEGEDYLQHNLFFVAAQGTSGLEPEFIWIRIGERPDEDEEAQFVDHGDLLGDGHDEIVVRFTSTENHRFAVYQRSRDGAHWEQMLMTGALECR
jgi:hypothetical protein